jgi:hypothetical protein
MALSDLGASINGSQPPPSPGTLPPRLRFIDLSEYHHHLVIQFAAVILLCTIRHASNFSEHVYFGPFQQVMCGYSNFDIIFHIWSAGIDIQILREDSLFHCTGMYF